MSKDIFLNLPSINTETQKNELPTSIQLIDLIEAIENKDHNLVEQFLKTNPLPKTLKGKRIGELAFENFDEKIMDILVENGMKFFYLDSLAKVSSGQGVGAVKYYVEKVVKKELNYSQQISILNNACDNNDLDTLNYILEKQKYTGAITPRLRHVVLNLAINEKNDRLFENIINHCVKTENNPSGWGFSMKRWILGAGFSFDGLLFLQNIYNKSNIVKKYLNENFPLYKHPSIKKDKLLNLVDAQEIEGMYVYGYENGIKLNDMIEVMIAKSHPAIHEMVKRDEYKKTILNKLKDKLILSEFINHSNSDEIKKVFKHIPEIMKWADDKGNNIAHYCIVIHGTQTIASMIYSADKNLLIEENNSGRTPLTFASQKIKTKMESQLINRTLFDNKVGKRQVKKRNNQRKRVM